MVSRQRFFGRPAALAAALAAALIAAVFTGSSVAGERHADADRRSTVYVDIDAGKPADPNNFNPYAANQRSEQGLSQVAFEPLLQLDSVSGKVLPYLARSMTPSSGGRVWVLTLRNGIRWSDGKPLTADDVIFSMRLVQTHADLNASNKYAGVKLKRLDALRVRMTLPKADPRFVLKGFASVLTSQQFFVVPRHIWASVKDPATFSNFDLAKGWPVTTGPYRLTGVTPTTFTWTRNAGWWGAKTGFGHLPAPKTIVFNALGTQETRAAALARNDLDVGASFSIGTLQALTARNRNIRAWLTKAPYGYPDLCMRSLDFMTEAAPWNDPQLRWAVAYAINRRKLIATVFQGATSGALTMLPDYRGLDRYVVALQKAGVFKQYPISTSSQAKARQLIESRGYTLKGGIYEKDGAKLSLVLSTYQDPGMNGLASAIAEQLRQVGIDASTNVQTIPNFVNNLLAGKFEANVFFGACGSTIDPWQSMNAFNPSQYVPRGTNTTGFYANTFRWNTPTAKTYGAVVDQIGKLGVNAPAITPLFVKAMRLFYRELPSIPLVQYQLINPVNETYWKGWPTGDDAYIVPMFSGPAFHVVLQHLKPAK